MKEQFCTKTICKALQELGCNIKNTFGMETALYGIGELIFYANYGVMGSGLDEDYIPAILWQQAIDFILKKLDELYDTKSNHKYVAIKLFSDNSGMIFQQAHSDVNEIHIEFNNLEEGLTKAIKLCKKK